MPNVASSRGVDHTPRHGGYSWACVLLKVNMRGCNATVCGSDPSLQECQMQMYSSTTRPKWVILWLVFFLLPLFALRFRFLEHK